MASLGHKAPCVWSCQKAIGNQGQHWHTLAVHCKAMVSQEQGEITPTHAVVLAIMDPAQQPPPKAGPVCSRVQGQNIQKLVALRNSLGLMLGRWQLDKKIKGQDRRQRQGRTQL